MAKTMSNITFPITEVRSQFLALKRQYHGKTAIYFDGPGGSQVVRAAIEAMAKYMIGGGANLHGQFPTSIETEAIIEEARQSIADLLGANADEVAFGANMTTLTYAISRALSRNWSQTDELVVTEMDHRANVDPWLAVAAEKGMTVRWIKVDPNSVTLDLNHLESIITERTRLVAVGLASNAVGTINDVARISARARRVGALVSVDAVHAVPHIAVDRDQIGADILICSAYKFFGPHIGTAVIRRELFETLIPYKLIPASDYIPDKLETGTQNHEGIAAISPTIDFIASLGIGNTRRERILSGYSRFEEYENSLAEEIRMRMAEIPRIRLYQAPSLVKKTPTIAFQIEGLVPEQVCKRMAEEYSLFIASGDFYAILLAKALGVSNNGGWIRAGLAPYNTQEEVDIFINALKRII